MKSCIDNLRPGDVIHIDRLVYRITAVRTTCRYIDDPVADMEKVKKSGQCEPGYCLRPHRFNAIWRIVRAKV